MGGVVFLATAPTQSPSLPCSCNSGEESLGFYEVWRAHIHKGRAPVTVTLRPAVLAVVVGECSGVPAYRHQRGCPGVTCPGVSSLSLPKSEQQHLKPSHLEVIFLVTKWWHCPTPQILHPWSLQANLPLALWWLCWLGFCQLGISSGRLERGTINWEKLPKIGH